ncbi:hypothetical protein Tco_1067172 [Tanacetum coccineum]|uniref:Uncharacterized protein n=1 Tax=Tanacetum coccineum TaxID=301880 RepID=A0ABQ5HDW6_9ASTR
MAAESIIPQLVDKKGGSYFTIAPRLELEKINKWKKRMLCYLTAKATWTDLVHSFKGPSDTKENKIMDLKLEYQTFRAKPSESLSQTYTRYKTLRNQLPNDGVTLPKHEINVGFMNSIFKK